MSGIDLAIVVVYVVGLFVFGISIGLRETADDFLVLSRKAGFPLVLFSIVSTWVGVGTTVATAASGYDTGLSLGATAGAGALVAVIAAGIFAPTIKRFGDRFGAHTLGDFFTVRYSSANRVLVGTIVVCIYVLFTAAQFVGMAALLDVWGGLRFEVAVGFAALSTIVYTAFAGIKSDFYTDAVHFWVMVLVLFGVLLPIILLSTDAVSSLAQLPPSYFDPFAFGGVSFFIAGLIFGTGGVFVSMEIWQRIYASTSAQTARWALIGSAGIILVFYFWATFLGMITKVLVPGLADRDMALFALMEEFLPSGILGLGVAAFLAVFISSVNTMMMVVSATVTKDFYRGVIKPTASDKQVLRVGRVVTLLVGMIGLGIAVTVQDVVTLSVNALFMLLIFLPAVVGGFFWRRATSRASFLSVLLGFVVTVALIPITPNTAFVPGFLVSLVVFVAGSIFSSHSASERIELTPPVDQQTAG